jgi:3-oxoacyl-[acyl-carrier-protein] synthase II
MTDELRIAVTGLGAVSPVGGTAPRSFSALLEGRSGVVDLSALLDARFDVRIGAPARDFSPETPLGPKQARRHGRFTLLAVSAAREAIADAGLHEAGYAPARIACVVGVGLGGLEAVDAAAVALHERGPKAVSPYGIAALVPNMAAGMIAIEAGLMGPCYAIASACASGAHAIGDALNMLRRGQVDAVVAGGAEACLTPLSIASFSSMRALSRSKRPPAEVSRPFDRERDGFVLGEGAGMLVLETEQRARKRNVNIYAELAGYAATADAFHETQPRADGLGVANAMRQALVDARLAPDAIDYVNAHGTSTVFNDRMESLAIANVFGAHSESLWVSSTKSMTGHLLGAAGAFEAVVSCLVLRHQQVPPTLNCDATDEDCKLDYVPGHARSGRIRATLSNSFGFGGQNAALIMAAYS